MELRLINLFLCPDTSYLVATKRRVVYDLNGSWHTDFYELNYVMQMYVEGTVQYSRGMRTRCHLLVMVVAPCRPPTPLLRLDNRHWTIWSLIVRGCNCCQIQKTTPRNSSRCMIYIKYVVIPVFPYQPNVYQNVIGFTFERVHALKHRYITERNTSWTLMIAQQ